MFYEKQIKKFCYYLLEADAELHILPTLETTFIHSEVGPLT
jgi:hypothetical protein